ncbi:MAG: hypothetical protein ABH817_01230, partial [archaeon]
NKNPLIEGVQVIPEEDVIPRARFINQDEVYAYQERVKAKYFDNPRALKSLLADVKGAERVLRVNKKTREPEHSNFWVVAELESMGIPVASAETLDILARTNPEVLEGHYGDIVSLVLRSATDYSYSINNPVIVDLIKQLKKRTKTRNIKYPVLISGQITPVDGQTNYGLLARLEERTKIHSNVRELDYKNSGRKFSRTDERGVPIFDEEGTRTFYAKISGLSRLCLCGYLGSNDGSLADSGSDGRVVVEVGEANAPKLGDYTLRLAERKARLDQALVNRAKIAQKQLDEAYKLALKEL